jgi:diguanylate cyclase (GGDEF)-like protein
VAATGAASDKKDVITNETLRAIIALQNHIVLAGLDAQAVMNTVVTELPRLIPAASGAVLEVCEGESMVCRAASGPFTGAIGQSVPRAHSLPGLCAASGKPLHTDDTETDSRVARDHRLQLAMRSMICYPLFAADDCFGVCIAASERPRAFGPDDMELLEMLASVIGASLQHAALFAQAERVGRIDPLTSLANRRAYDEEIIRSVASAHRRGESLALVMLDLNEFKEVNDAHGHAAGDSVLQAFSRLLEENVRSGDRVFRLGGDEFCVILINAAKTEALMLLRRIETALKRLEKDGMKIAASAGIAQLEALEDGASLSKRADVHMYHAKRKEPGQSALRLG